MRIFHSAIAQNDNKMSYHVGVRVKPKVPHKPSHLVKSLRKTASFDQQSMTAMPGSLKREPETAASCEVTDNEQKMNCYEDLRCEHNSYTPPTTPRPGHQRRKSSHAVLLTTPFGDSETRLHLRSLSTVSIEENRNQSRDTIYEDGGYVPINFPQVEPGTMIQPRRKPVKADLTHPTYPVKEDSNTFPSIQNLSDDSSSRDVDQRCSNNIRRCSLVELQENFRRNSLDSTVMSQNKENKNVDENGYEVPLAFKMPTYMLFDSDVMSSSADETDAIENVPRNHSVISKSKKKRRLARYKRKESPSQDHPAALTSSLSRKFVLKFSNTKKQEMESHPLPDPPTNPGQMPPSAKAIPSFLSARLKQSKSDSHLGSLSVSLKSDSTIYSPYVYSSTDDESEWSDSSDYSCDCDDSSCYYQQIDPPDLSGHASDHDYEVIEDCLGYGHKSKPSINRKKSMKSVMASVVSGRKRDKRTKSSESNKYPPEIGISPKLQRKNMQDMRSTSVAHCTWETVSTPGILKLNDFKEFGRNKIQSGIITAQAR